MTPAPTLTLVVVQSAPGPVSNELFVSLAEDLRDGLLEVLVVSESEPSVMAGLDGARWLASPPGATVPTRRGLGLAAARTPLVALTESFCVPAPGWTRAVLEAHGARGVAAVGGPVGRRCGTGADWALTLVEYGRFFDPGLRGQVDDLPGMNVAYRVERLRASLGALPDQVVEVEFHAALRAAGETLWREPAALMWDGSEVPPGEAIRAQYRHGRYFGGRRVEGSGVAVRLARALLAPAVPAVFAGRITAGVLAASQGRALVRALPRLGVLLCAWAAGEAVGSVAGPGDTESMWR